MRLRAFSAEIAGPSAAKGGLERDGFELNRREHLVHLAPLAGRGRNSLCEFRVRGPIRESDLVERPPHPNPLPASGAREKRSAAST
jgi:hypothetical protein